MRPRGTGQVIYCKTSIRISPGLLGIGGTADFPPFREHSTPSSRQSPRGKQNPANTPRRARNDVILDITRRTRREVCPFEAPSLLTARSRHVTAREAPDTSGEEGGDPWRDGGYLRATLGGHVSSNLVGPSWGRGWRSAERDRVRAASAGWRLETLCPGASGGGARWPGIKLRRAPHTPPEPVSAVRAPTPLSCWNCLDRVALRQF